MEKILFAAEKKILESICSPKKVKKTQFFDPPCEIKPHPLFNIISGEAESWIKNFHFNETFHCQAV